VKIIYVCPYAHYTGHHPHVSTVEPAELADAGHDVLLVTFCGIIGGTKPLVASVNAVNDCRFYQLLRRYKIMRWVFMVVETFFTLRKAVKLYEHYHYDVIHLRDGEPFLFVHHLVSLGHNVRWAVSLTGTIIYPPRGFGIYNIAIRLLNLRLWRILYKANRHKVMYMAQNELAMRDYQKYFGEALKSRVCCVPWGIDGGARIISKIEARKALGLPPHKWIVLSFGAPHPGKDMDVLFKALGYMPDGVLLLHGGSHVYSVGDNPENLCNKYGLDGRAIIYDRFISEEEKPFFFCAADLIVLAYKKEFASTASMLWEAAKYGLPVVASDTNELGRMVASYCLGLRYRTGDPLDLSEKVTDCLSVPAYIKKKWQQNAKHFIADYSVDKWLSNCATTYEALMK